MKKYYLFALVISLNTLILAQVNPGLNDLVLKTTAEVNVNPPEITIHWKHSTATGDKYRIYRKKEGGTSWSLLQTLAVTDTSYVDQDVELGQEYEYYLAKINGPAPNPSSWSYISAGINVLPDLVNRGIILVLDTSITNGLTTEIDNLKNDLKSDGFKVAVISTNPNESVSGVKTKIVNVYNTMPAIYNSLLLLGHVAVPYSGDLNPDAHTNHKGAWPTDLYYGDVDGNWTDATVYDTSGSSTRTHNIPNDGKFDQSTVPSDMEMEVGRVDFYDMPAFTKSEQELLKAYLLKNSAFRNKAFVPGRRGLMDEGSFANTAAGEGFGQTAPRAMIPLLGNDSFFVKDYFTELSSASYLWSYGQGAGSYTTCSGIGATSDFVNDSVQSVFTTLFGSYFGDYDSKNNFMRASLGSGTVLTCSWSSSRPVWYYHHMAMGHTIGYSAVKSVNYNNYYYSLNFGPGFTTNRGVHTVLLGDPTLRPFYITGPTNLVVLDNGNGDADLTWNPSIEANILGYNIYRSPTDSIDFKLINTSPVNGTSFTDLDIRVDGIYEYFVRAVFLETTASGTYYNESPGVYDTAQIVNAVGIDVAKFKDDIILFPNPTSGMIYLKSNLKIETIYIFDNTGRLVASAFGKNELNLTDYKPGIYIGKFITSNGVINLRIVKN